MEVTVSRILMEAAFKLSGVMGADMFFLMQTADGKRRFAGQEALVDDFVSGDLKLKKSDVHLRFYDDDDYFHDDDEDEELREEPSVDGDAKQEALSDVSEGALLDDGASVKTSSSTEGKDESNKRKASIGADLPAAKAVKKTNTKTKSDASKNRDQSAEKKHDGKAGKKSRESSVSEPASATNKEDSSSKSSGPAYSGESAHVILRYLPLKMADANIKSKLEYLFKKYGAKVNEVRIIHKNPKQNRYAIAVCQSRTQASKLVNLTRDIGFRAKLNFDTPMTAEVIHKFDEHDPRATRTLRVSNLHPDVGKPQLRELFEPFGEIFSLEMRHSQNEKGSSVGMAFIQYPHVENAVRAREKLIGLKLKNYPLLCGFVKSVRSDSLILNNVDLRRVESMKNRFGTLNDVYVKKEKQQALLFFRDTDCAVKAMSVISQKRLAGNNVQMDYASVDLQDAFLGKAGGVGDKSDAPAEKLNLVRLDDGKGIRVERIEVAASDDIGGIPVEDGASDISDGEMEDDLDEGNNSVGRSSPTPSDGANTSVAGGPKIIRTAAVNNDGKVRSTLEDSAVSMDSTADGAEAKQLRLFIGNLNTQVTEEDIRTEFESFGKIIKLDITPDSGYCFVSFEDDAAHSTAMDAMNGKKIRDSEMLICLD